MIFYGIFILDAIAKQSFCNSGTLYCGGIAAGAEYIPPSQSIALLPILYYFPIKR